MSGQPRIPPTSIRLTRSLQCTICRNACAFVLVLMLVCLPACRKSSPTDAPALWNHLRHRPVTSPHGFRLSGAVAPLTGTIARPDLAQTTTLTATVAAATTLTSAQRNHALLWHDLAVGELHLARRRLAAPHPAVADWFNDAGVTHAEWALRHGRPEDFEAALNLFHHPPDAAATWTAHFNRALLFQHLGLTLRAKTEWEHYLATEQDPSWASVARQHLANLALPFPNRTNFRDTLANVSDCPETPEAQRFFADHLGALLDESGSLAEAFVTSGASHPLKLLQCLARQAQHQAGDAWATDLTQAVVRLHGTAQAAPWLTARQNLRQARQLYPIEGKPTAAEPLYAHARQIFLATGDVASAAEAELGLVYCAVQRPETTQLEQLSAALLSTARTRHYTRLEGQTLRVRAQLALRQARPALAVTHCRSALGMFQTLSDWEETQRTLLILSDAHEQQGNGVAALSALRQLLHLGRQRGTNPRRHSQACAFAARTCAWAGAFELGLAFAEEARTAAIGQTFPTFQLDAEILSAVLSIKAGQRKVAADALDRAARVWEGIAEPRMRTVLALDYLPTAAWCRLMLNEPEAALQLCAAAAENLQTGQHDAYWPLVCSVRGAAHLALGNLQAAESAFETGIHWLETTRLYLARSPDRQRFFHRHAELYERLATLYLHRRRIADAFACLEQARARTLLDRCHTRYSTSFLFPARRRSLVQTLQMRLPEHIVVLAYAVGDEQLDRFVLTRHSLHHTTQPLSRTQLVRDIQALNDLLANLSGDPVHIRQIGQRLYATLMAPLELSGQNSTRLVIIPDGPLHGLPWAALCDAEGRWLAQQVPFSLCPSTAALVQALEREARLSEKTPVGTVLIAADPILGPTGEAQDLPPLPGARDEAICVQSIVGSSVTLTGSQVTKAQLVASLHRAYVAHLAVHGRGDLEAPWQSALYLTATSEDDGQLTAAEVYEYFFPQLRLVVLSACESARGATLRGEGATGLGQAFLAAGAVSVVATLARTDDQFMRDLMCTFHAVQQGRASLAVALRDAWQAVVSQHPARWANVILLGAP